MTNSNMFLEVLSDDQENQYDWQKIDYFRKKSNQIIFLAIV
jgi:hypothetical protein